MEVPRPDGIFSCSRDSYDVCGCSAIKPAAEQEAAADANIWKPWGSTFHYAGPSGLNMSPPPWKRPQPGAHAMVFKKTIPNVILAVSEKGRVYIDSTEQTIFIKVLETSVTVESVLAEVGMQIGVSCKELVLLDSKLSQVLDAPSGQHKLYLFI